MSMGDLAEIERTRLRALVDADLAVADRLHADDFQLITPSGDSLTKAEYLRGVATGELDYLIWDPEDIEVHRDGHMACLRYRSTIKIRVGGEESGPAQYWHTDFYEKRDERWQVVWSQATAIRG
jgi:ketosteroid isomerase-like protein